MGFGTIAASEPFTPLYSAIHAALLMGGVDAGEPSALCSRGHTRRLPSGGEERGAIQHANGHQYLGHDTAGAVDLGQDHWPSSETPQGPGEDTLSTAVSPPHRKCPPRDPIGQLSGFPASRSFRITTPDRRTQSSRAETHPLSHPRGVLRGSCVNRHAFSGPERRITCSDMALDSR
jgi:hypothetical protein